MFKAITWGQYSLTLLVLLALYYAYVGVMYYRLELLGLFKGKVQNPSPAPTPKPAVAALVGKSSLVGRPALAPAPATPAQVAKTTEQSGDEGPEATEQEEQQSAEESLVADLPELDLPTAEVTSNFKDEIGTENSEFDDNVINFTQQTDPETFQEVVSSVEAAPEAFEPDFTMDVAQLGNYFERAAEGLLTPAQLVEQAPALDNTELLAAFFKTTTKSAQQLTSQVYADVAEPGFD